MAKENTKESIKRWGEMGPIEYNYSSLLGQEPRTVDKRIQATIQDEINYLSKYGSDYWNSGTTGLLGWGAFSGVQQSLGASGRGERAWNNLNEINFKMKGGYSQEELWNMFNDELINTFPENDDYRLSIGLMDREENYGGGRIKKAEGGVVPKVGKQSFADIAKSLLNRRKPLKKSPRYIDPSPEGEYPILTERTKELNNIYRNIISSMDKTDKDFSNIIKDRVTQGNLTREAAEDLEKLHSINLAITEMRLRRTNEYADYLKTYPFEAQRQKYDFSKGGRVAKAKGGEMEDQMNALAISVAPARVEEQETHTMPDGTVMPGATHEEYEQQLSDEEMEADYVDYVVDETLSTEDQDYLESALAKDARLSGIFDQVVESASEFSGSGPIEGPGTEVSDSIPARLSDGEFVFTAKAVEEIGADVLQQQMKAAEAKADGRQKVVHGGVIDEEERAVPIQTRGSVAAQGNIPNVVKQSRQVEEEMLKSSPRRYYVPVSG
jgi:hypothetical protein